MYLMAVTILAGAIVSQYHILGCIAVFGSVMIIQSVRLHSYQVEMWWLKEQLKEVRRQRDICEMNANLRMKNKIDDVKFN